MPHGFPPGGETLGVRQLAAAFLAELSKMQCGSKRPHSKALRRQFQKLCSIKQDAGAPAHRIKAWLGVHAMQID
jgi:hypothetical protein